MGLIRAHCDEIVLVELDGLLSARTRPFGRIALGTIVLLGLSACVPSLPMQSLQSVGNGISRSFALSGTEKVSTLETPIRKREFSASSEIVFAATMSVAQDAGFRLQTADATTGLITGVGSSSRRLKIGLAGLSETVRSPIISIQVEAISSDRTLVRLVLVNGSSGGTGFSAEQTVRDPAAYEQLYALLNDEVNLRKNSHFRHDLASNIAPLDAVDGVEQWQTVPAPDSAVASTEEVVGETVSSALGAVPGKIASEINGDSDAKSVILVGKSGNEL